MGQCAETFAARPIGQHDLGSRLGRSPSLATQLLWGYLRMLCFRVAQRHLPLAALGTGLRLAHQNLKQNSESLGPFKWLNGSSRKTSELSPQNAHFKGPISVGQSQGQIMAQFGWPACRSSYLERSKAMNTSFVHETPTCVLHFAPPHKRFTNPARAH